MNILLAVDDSPFSRHMLAWLGANPDWLAPSQRFTVVHAQAPLPHGLRPLLDDEQIFKRRSAEAHEVFRPVRAFLDHHGIKALYVQKEGPAAQVLLDEATAQEANLIVMGSHGHGALGQVVLGSVVSRVLAGATVPVLVVPPAHASS